MSNKLNYLDKKGLTKVFSLIKFGHKKIWHGTLAEWEALSTAEKAEYDQAEVIDEYTGVPVVVDKVESGNMNPVTSNAVANLIAFEDTSVTISVSANEHAFTHISIPLKTGYSLLGCFLKSTTGSIDTSAITACVGTTGWVQVFNNSMDAQSVTVSIRALYIKD